LSEKETQAYIEALDINPHNNKVRFRLSELYESQGKIQEALEILEIAQKNEEIYESELIETSIPQISISDQINDQNNYFSSANNHTNTITTFNNPSGKNIDTYPVNI
jgi:tetratricopeptide (TPR) repeat protein